jgi:hypothetical protein
VDIFIKTEFFSQVVSFVIAMLNANRSKITIEINFIKLFVSLADYTVGQDWLGSSQGSILWQKLIDTLCSSNQAIDSNHSEELSLLVIQLIKKMLFCNPDNQMLFAKYLTNLIRNVCPAQTITDYSESNSSTSTSSSSSSGTISGFLHQLIIQILLDDQTITVNFQRKSPIFKTACNSSLGLLTHPRFGTGNNNRTMEVCLLKTCTQLAHLVSDMPISHILAGPTATTTTTTSTTSTATTVKETKNPKVITTMSSSKIQKTSSLSKDQNNSDSNSNSNSEDQELLESSTNPDLFIRFNNDGTQMSSSSMSNMIEETVNETIGGGGEIIKSGKSLSSSSGSSSSTGTYQNKNNNSKLNSSKCKNNKINNNVIPKIRLFIKEQNGREIFVPNEYTLGKALNIYLNQTKQRKVQGLTMTVHFFHNNNDNQCDLDNFISTSSNDNEYDEFNNNNNNSEIEPMSTPLDAFVKCDGLIVLADRLSILMPFIHEPLLSVTEKDRLSSNMSSSGHNIPGLGGLSSSGITDQIPKTSPDFVDYVIMNESDEPFVDDMYNDMPMPSSTSVTIGANSQSKDKIKKITMPPHAFIAFGLFLKIPGYAAVMLRNRRQAQCILKLLLGANRNKEEEFGLSLSTMPFTALKELLNDAKMIESSSKRIELAEFMLKNRILTLILSILSTLSHHPHRIKKPHFQQKISSETSVSGSLSGGHGVAEQASHSTVSGEEKSNLYWAKGTGFGTGSTIQQWDAEKTLMQQRMEEEHVTCILEILSSYIECYQDNMCDLAVELFDHSCVINALSSYLRNDSVLDMSRHIPLYKSALNLLQSLIIAEKLRCLVQKCNIFELISNMKQFVDSYMQRIRYIL